MAGEVVAGIAALKMAGDIVSGLIATRDLHKFNGDLIKLQEQLLQAYSAMFTLSEQRNSLQTELSQLKEEARSADDKRSEMERYKLREFGLGVFAYVLGDTEAEEPLHYLCATCYQKGEKSILQCLTQDGYYQCNNCKNGFSLGRSSRRPQR